MRLLIAVLVLFGFAASLRAEPLARVEGKSFIAPNGTVLAIKGINLGNWLMPEGYMFKFEVAKAPYQISGAFERLLGHEKAVAFWKQFRNAYIGADDIAFIKAAGFNTVRIPLHCRLFMTD